MEGERIVAELLPDEPEAHGRSGAPDDCSAVGGDGVVWLVVADAVVGEVIEHYQRLVEFARCGACDVAAVVGS